LLLLEQLEGAAIEDVVWLSHQPASTVAAEDFKKLPAPLGEEIPLIPLRHVVVAS
jgi:hypothetical protein